MDDPVRADIWLWAARFYKTRSLATEAVKGGLVHLGGDRLKPAKEVKPGDVLQVTRGPDRRTVVVRATARRRGPASEAARLFEETPDSIAARERAAEQRRIAGQQGAFAPTGPRPTKRDRRRFDATRRGGRS